MRSSERPSGPTRAGSPPEGPGGPPQEGCRAGGATAFRITQYLIALAVLVAIGIATVWQHTRFVRAGYRLGALEREREELREQERKLELQRVRESRLEALEERARKLGLRLPSEDPEVYELMR